MASGLEEQLGEYFDEVYETIIGSCASNVHEYDEQVQGGDNNTPTALSLEPHMVS